MYDKIPGLLYSTGALFTIVSWVFILFSRNIHPKNKKILILRLSIIWMLFFASSVLMLVSNLFFRCVRGLPGSRCPRFLQPEVYTAGASSDLCDELLCIHVLFHEPCQGVHEDQVTLHHIRFACRISRCRSESRR